MKAFIQKYQFYSPDDIVEPVVPSANDKISFLSDTIINVWEWDDIQQIANYQTSDFWS